MLKGHKQAFNDYIVYDPLVKVFFYLIFIKKTIFETECLFTNKASSSSFKVT